MLYLNERDLITIGVQWSETVEVIRRAVDCLSDGDFAQPVKPYLRYRNPENRIIAMPAFLGGTFNIAGIKWIASFPDNIHEGIPRAHSVVVLNHADSGRPVAIINTALLSVIRTASVTGLMIRAFDAARRLHEVKIGISGFGPIGQYHLAMCAALFGERIAKVSIFDLRPPVPPANVLPGRIEIAKSWQEAYDEADLFMTCTVSSAPYIDRAPKPGSLQLNVSLRDYTTKIFDALKDAIIVDDWEEVCREATDIEAFHKEKGLRKEHVKSITEVVRGGAMKAYSPTQAVMFNPMGMGVFDVAMAAYLRDKALEKKVGTILE